MLFKHKGLELQDEIKNANQPHLVEQYGGLDVCGTQEDIDLDLQGSGGCPTPTRETARAENFSEDIGTGLAVVV